MSPSSVKTSLFITVAAVITGCANPGNVALQPVENPVPPLASGVYGIKMVDVPPAPTSEARLRYPREMLLAGISGKAMVMFTVGADGSVEDASVLRASDVRFGEAAMASVLKWRFRPAQLNGIPVACRMTEPFGFTAPPVPIVRNPPPTNDPGENNYARLPLTNEPR